MMSPHVELVVMKALEKRPDMRYPTMDEMMRAMADPVGYVEAHGGARRVLAAPADAVDRAGADPADADAADADRRAA